MRTRRIRTGVLVAASAAVAIFGGGMVATAAIQATSATALPPHTLHGCVTSGNRVLQNVYVSNTAGLTCPTGTFQVVWPGADWPFGQLATKAATTAAVPVQNIGGSVLPNRQTNLTKITLSPGTYLVAANAQFNRTVAAPNGPDTYANLVLWSGTSYTSFSQVVGSYNTGAMSRNIYIDSSASGSAIITVPSGGETLNVGAFAYNEDRSAGASGSIQVSAANVSAVRVG
jgi:hypothetical protein